MSEQTPNTVTTSAAPTQTAPPEKPGNVIQRFLSGAAGRNLGLVIALVLLIVVGAITAGDRFMNVENFLTIIRFGSIIGVISIGMTFVITAGGIDLSVGSVMGLASVVASLVVGAGGIRTRPSWLLMVAVALAVGGAAGLRQRNHHRLRQGRAVHGDPRDARRRARSGRDPLEQDDADRQVQGFLEFFRGDFLGIAWLDLDLRPRGRRRLVPAQPHHVRSPHRRHRRQLRGRRASPASR